MAVRFTRRQILQTSAVAATAAVGFHGSLAATESKSPNERLNIGGIGTANRAGADLGGVASQNMVALVDIDAKYLEQAGKRYSAARRYRDFRVMLEKEGDKLDAVVVGTADHTHAPAAAMAMRMGKHVYCEKPLTHTVFEARTLAELAKKNHLVTQMGTQIHALDNYRRVVELIETGAIGKVREVHVWVGVNYSGAKFVTKPQPAHVDWDLWLGPAPKRPYSIGVHPARWRDFWDYGTGGLGDFGCHYMDLAHWALKLRHPTHCKASGPTYDPVATTAGLVVEYKYPARGDLPPVEMTWYDGGRRPEILNTLKRKDGSPLKWGNGQLFIGEHGMLISDYGKHLLLPEDKFVDFKRPEPYIPKSIGHHAEWVQAIKTNGQTTCNFNYSGALTEAVLLGTVAYRSGCDIEWDAKNLKPVGAPQAEQFVHKEYRKGWTL